MDPSQAYSPAGQRKGRRRLLSFEVVNTFSFSLLAGNLITLLCLRLGASDALVGLLSALPYLAFLIMPAARGFVHRWGLVRTFGWAWTGRYVLVIPIVAAPFLASNPVLALALVVGSYLLFHLMRGLGLVSISPLNNALSEGRDRGAFLSKKSMVISVSSIGAGVLSALLLGREAPFELYGVALAGGVVLGLLGCWIVFKIPEPKGGVESAKMPFFPDLKAAWKLAPLRKFFVAFGVIIFLTGMGRPFLLVYAKQSFNMADDMVLLFSVAGNLGAIVMSWVSRLVLDRLGAKPLLSLWAAIFVLSMGALGSLPPLTDFWGLAFLLAMFFTTTLGGAGIENSSQLYYFHVTPPLRQFNLGMVYYLIMGIMGGAGALLGGIFLEFLKPSLPDHGPFGVFFLVVFALSLLSLLLIFRLDRLGSKSITNSLMLLFSPRDLRTMDLLRQLDRSPSLKKEMEILRKVPTSGSDLAVEDILKRLGSPLFEIRSQALLVLEKLPIDDKVVGALIRHVQEHPFASAYRAARILGQKSCYKALPALREALKSEDYLLQAYSASALGNLGDIPSRPDIEKLIETHDNALVTVHGIAALKQFGSLESLPALMKVLKRPGVSMALRDEVVFGLADLLGIDEWIYPRYLQALDNPDMGIAMLKDELPEKEMRSEWMQLLSQIQGDAAKFQTAAQLLWHDLEVRTNWPGARELMGLGLLSPESLQYYRLRFFTAAFLVYSRLLA